MTEKILFGVEGVHISVDDVIIRAPTMPELVKCLRQVFKSCRQYNLKLNKSKCEFGVSKTLIFEHIVLAYSIQPDPTKTEAIKRIPPPENVSDLLSGHVVTEITFVSLQKIPATGYPVKTATPKLHSYIP